MITTQATLNAALLIHARALIPSWMPGGELRGSDYICGSLRGGRGDQCSVSLISGKWHDFFSEKKGPDLISLFAAIHEISMKDAFSALANDFAEPPSKPEPPKPEPKKTPKKHKPEIIPELPPLPSEPPADLNETHKHAPTLSQQQKWDALGLTLSGNGRPHNSVNNVAKMILNHKKLMGNIWFDEFYCKVFSSWKNKKPRPWNDQDYINLMVWLQDKLEMSNLTKNNVIDAVSFAAHQNIKNEPRDWIKSLEWDGTPRVLSLFSKYFGAPESEYTSTISKNFMVSMVARLFKPGCKVDNMVILEGNQGAFKSSALKALAGKWFTENNNDMNRNDFFQALDGFMLVELSELDSFNKSEATRIKTVLSTASDNYRSPYGRHTENRPRQSIFVGTTNESDYLRDSTGGRRFWPISCGNIELDQITNDREQLFAEAYRLFLSGENWWIVPESAKIEQEMRRERDPWEEVLSDFCASYNGVFITTADLAKQALGVEYDKLSSMISRRIGKIMRSFGWVYGKQRHGLNSNVKAGWIPPSSESAQTYSRSNDNASQQSVKLPNYAPQH